MKRILITIAVCFSVITSYGQTEKKNLIGTHFALGGGEYLTRMDGGGSYDTKYYYGFGLDYSRMLSKRLDLCSGFEYQYSKMTGTPALEVDLAPFNENLKLATIPVMLKYHFWKYFYVNGGLLFNVAARIGSEHRVGGPTKNLNMFLGCGIGVGFRYEFNSGFMLTVNPSIRCNGLENAEKTESFLGFLKAPGKIDGYQFFQSGVSLGIGYKF